MIARAAELRLSGEPEELILKLDGEYIRVRVREQERLLEEIRERHGTTAAARERFRMGIVRSFYAEYGRILQGGAIRDGEDVEKALRSSGHLNRVVDRAWPAVTPERLVRSLFTTPAFLAEAAAGRPRRGRAEAAAPARCRAGATPTCRCSTRRTRSSASRARTYDHVIVDEAQDLTPMQLRMIARRARDGALTILGDVAQGTGAVSYESWADVLPHLPRGNDAEVEELRHAYRVPREIMNLALPLLDTIAPELERPLAYRVGGAEPVLRQVPEDALLREAYHEAARLAREDGLVALIVPDELVEPALAHESAFDSIPLLTPRAAKGLEFDHVIVVEPALIAEREQGLRELYVALTRPTTTLVVVHARPLPAELQRT